MYRAYVANNLYGYVGLITDKPGLSNIELLEKGKMVVRDCKLSSKEVGEFYIVVVPSYSGEQRITFTV